VVNPQLTRTIARTAVRSEEKTALESVVTVVPRRSATMLRVRGSAQMMSLPIDGDVSKGTPATTREAGWVGSDCSSARFDPAVVDSLRVAIFSAVPGLATNVSMVVLCCSALDLANSKASRFAQLSPASAAVGVIDSSPAGPLIVVFAKKRLIAFTGEIARQAITDNAQRHR
jgi:hypothetical protein